MTPEDLALLVTGQIITAGVFACGVLVGCSLRRKDALTHDDDNEKAEDEGQRLRYFDSLR